MRISAAVSVVMASSVASAQTPTSPGRARHRRELQSRPDRCLFRRRGQERRFRKIPKWPRACPSRSAGNSRPNRDTLYSFAIADLDAGPVTITLPDAGKRYMGMQIINQDQYTPATYYEAGTHTLTREMIGTLCHCRGPLPGRFLKQGRCPASPRFAGCDQVQPGTTRRIRNSSLG
jgi:hypothetical protein